MVEAVNLVDEQDIAGLQAGEDRRQVAGPLDHRAGGHLDAGPHLVGDDIGQGGLAQPRKSVKQGVVQGFAAVAGRLEEHGQALLELFLADILP